MDALLRLLMGPWTTYILWTLRQRGPTRFGMLKREVRGISSRMLTERLRTLEEAGVVFRVYRPSIPPEVTYGLTPRGLELREVLDALDTLARRWDSEDAGRKSIHREPVLPVTN
jgi:DNA-binding HxlR family transcriptional regulator